MITTCMVTYKWNDDRIRFICFIHFIKCKFMKSIWLFSISGYQVCSWEELILIDRQNSSLCNRSVNIFLHSNFTIQYSSEAHVWVFSSAMKLGIEVFGYS